MINEPAFFRRFADCVHNEGERPAVELLEHLEGKRDIAAVRKLIYRQSDGSVHINDETTSYTIDQLSCPDFADIHASDYFLPTTIFNLRVSRSCYWRKCSFCTHHQGSRHAAKSATQMADEIGNLQRNHGVCHFHFDDEAISPVYLRKLSEEIIAPGLDINFYIYACFERAFASNLFALAHRAGLRMIL